ncbi:TetR/AcrR family transcriptional regulator [Nocardia wallacei]|uniref:TetR/AcrR family transcriptional regulator n=1 Tax=Nocardia wallacei TaxID=480035 RepID=UPI0024567FF8|nr:helix-turn-helix domain-containing protein [Nocardia wallacei]
MASLRNERTQESRRLLIAAAAELFAEKGYRQTSFIDIAERAGISRGSIPWHFGNKLGLLEAVLDDQLETVLASFTVRSGDPLDQVAEYVRMPATRMFTTLLAEAVEADSPIREHYARLHEALRRGVQASLSSAALPPGSTPETAAVLLVGVVMGVHAQWRVDPAAVNLDTIHATLRTLLPASVVRP